MFLNKKNSKFLMNLANKRGSASAIGRETFACLNTIYKILDEFKYKGLIEIRKEGRNLSVEITEKGRVVIALIVELSQY
jgi:DNA-binding MarR family transcriptional regulator